MKWSTKVGYHIDTKDPQKTERVFGYLQQTTTNIDIELGLELPVGPSTYPANAPEGRHFQAHRAKILLPFPSHQVELADAGYDLVENFQGIRGRGGIPIIAYHPRHEDLSPAALGNGGMIKTAPRMLHAGVCVARTATTTSLIAASMSAAGRVPCRNNSRVRTVRRSEAIRTPCPSPTTHA